MAEDQVVMFSMAYVALLDLLQIRTGDRDFDTLRCYMLPRNWVSGLCDLA